MIVPCGISSSLAADEREELYNFCKKLENDLAKDNIKVIGDYRENYSPGWKFNHWELKVKINKKCTMFENHQNCLILMGLFSCYTHEWFIGSITLTIRWLKITEKVSYNIASEASYVLSRQKFIENAKNQKMVQCGEVLKI